MRLSHLATSIGYHECPKLPQKMSCSIHQLPDYVVEFTRHVFIPKMDHAGQNPTTPVTMATIPTTLNAVVPHVGRSTTKAAAIKSPPTTNRTPFSVPPTFLHMASYSLVLVYICHISLDEQSQCHNIIQG